MERARRQLGAISLHWLLSEDLQALWLMGAVSRNTPAACELGLLGRCLPATLICLVLLCAATTTWVFLARAECRIIATFPNERTAGGARDQAGRRDCLPRSYITIQLAGCENSRARWWIETGKIAATGLRVQNDLNSIAPEHIRGHAGTMEPYPRTVMDREFERSTRTGHRLKLEESWPDPTHS